MTDEQGRVLDMVSEGKISVEEAERLLSALAGARDVHSAGPHAGLGEALHREVISVVMEEGGESVGEALQDDTFKVGEAPRVVIKNDNGRVRCEVGDEGAVRVRAILKNPRSVKYSVFQEGDVVTVEAKSKGKSSLLGFFGRRGSVDIVVTAPRATALDIRTGNGAVEASGFESESSVRTANGRIALQHMKGGLDVVATNGKISLGACEGDVIARTTNGPIKVEDAMGSINASTVNGPLTFSGELLPSGNSKLKTVNGPVGVTLLGQLSLKVDASCVAGRVKSELPGLKASGRSLEGTIGEGEAELVVRTVNGLINLRQPE